MRDTYGLYNYLIKQWIYSCSPPVTSVDTDVEELIDEGVHVCIAPATIVLKLTSVAETTIITLFLVV